MEKSKHHIYNFHIGFWNAFLISLMVIIQSALGILVTTSLTQAQSTGSIDIQSPRAGDSFQLNDIVNFSASTPSLAQQLTFNVYQSGGQNSLEQHQATSTDNLNWEFQWPASQAGDLEVEAVAQLFSGTPLVSSRVPITVLNAITVDLRTPASGDVIDQNTVNFQAVTTGATGLNFELFGPGGNFVFAGTQTVTGTWDFGFNANNQSVPEGDYQLKAVASDASGQTVETPDRSITIQFSQGTIQIIEPQSGSTVDGTILLSARTSAPSIDNVVFELTLGSSRNPFNGIQSTNDPQQWEFNLDTTSIANGNYSYLVTATQGTSIITSSNQSLIVDNALTPLAIGNTSLPTATQGQNYNHVMTATGGKLPYNWRIISGAFPQGLLMSGAGNISGIPAQNGNFNVTLEVGDADGTKVNSQFTLTVNQAPAVPNPNNNTNQPGTGTPADPAIPNPVDPDSTTPDSGTQDPANIPAETLTISEPANNATITGANQLIVLLGSVPMSVDDAPSVTLRGASGSIALNAIQGFLPTNNDGRKRWHILLNTTSVTNGTYTLTARAKADSGRIIQASPISVTVSNAGGDRPASDQPGTTDGTTGDNGTDSNVIPTTGGIVSPSAGQSITGTVNLQARIEGDDPARSVTFRITTPRDGIKVFQAIFNNSVGLWTAQWDTQNVRPGDVRVKADVVTTSGRAFSIREILVQIPAAPGTLGDANLPGGSTATPQLDQVVPSRVLQNVAADGTLPPIPAECQVAGITDEVRCNEFLSQRRIRLLDKNEEQEVKDSLRRTTGKRIEIKQGGLTQKKSKQSSIVNEVEEEEDVEDTVQKLLPFNIQRAKDVSVTVIASTEPPAALKPFVEQTVPGLLIFDKDGDGLSDDSEVRYGTDPENPDTDGDGFDDGTEIKNGFSPLGPGLLKQELAPLDKALLNNKPLDQPRFAGVIDDASYEVEEVRTIGEEGDSRLKIRGKGPANTVLTLYIYSSLPVVASVKTNASGNFEYEFSQPLTDGKHDVYIALNNDTGKIKEKSSPLGFFVQEAQAVSEEEFLAAAASTPSADNTFLIYYLIGAVLFIVVAAGLFVYYLRSKANFM